MGPGERAYRALLLLYPPSFRRAYGDAMVQLFADQRRARGRHAWFAVVRDLFVSLPVRHQEAIRAMNTQTKLFTSAVVVATGVVAFAAVGGALAALALMLVLAWVLVALLKERSTATPGGFWWKLTLAGAGIFALAFVIFAMPWPQSWRESIDGELAWWTGFFMVSLAIVCMAAGLLTGLVEVASRRRTTR